MKYYSPSTLGFYANEIHSTMPEDVIEISQDKYLELLNEASKAGNEITLNSEGCPVVTERVATKEDKINRIKSEIIRVESSQARAVREAALGDAARLQAIEEEIVSLREKMHEL